jgi:WD40 repeat protein
MDARPSSPIPPCPTVEAKAIATLPGVTGGVAALAFSPDRTLVAAAGGDGTARLWEINHKPPRDRGSVQQHANPFRSLAFSPNGRLLAAGSATLNGFVWLYDITDKTPKEAGVLRGAKGAIDALAFSPDSKLVAGAGEDRTLRIWEHGPTSRGDARAILPGHSGPIRALAFAPDGQGAATAARDSAVRVWSISRIRSWEKSALKDAGEVEAVAYTPDGKSLATASRAGGVQLWELGGIKPTVRMKFVGGPAGVRALLVTPDAQLLVGVGDDARVVNWDLRTGKPVQAWTVPTASGAAVALTADGRYLVTGSSGGAVALYRVAEKRA